MVMHPPVDPQRVQAFGGRLLSIFTGAGLTFMLAIGHRTGLFEALAVGPGTSQELAARAGLQERYVREWLGALTTSGIITYDAAAETYALPPEHALLLSGGSSRNLAPFGPILTDLGRHVPAVAACFQQGGGVAYDAFRPEFTDTMDDLWRRIFDEHLLDGFLARAAGLPDRLRAGLRVADIGCGTGHALNLLAQAFPASTFIGYDLASDAITRATTEADAMGLVNIRFEALDIGQIPTEPPFDLIMAFDVIHDLTDPMVVLRRIRRALAPDGLFFMVDFKFSSHVEENVGNPFAPLYYAVSTLHCLTVSLAQGGAGLGTIWGRQLAERMLAEAGFGEVKAIDSPRPQNLIYLCRP